MAEDNEVLEAKTVKIGNRVFKCFSDGSVEYEDTRRADRVAIRTFGCLSPSQQYRSITVNIEGRNKRLHVHRIVAMAFLPNPKSLPEVDHINRDKTDNRPENLRWVDHDTNMKNLDSIQTAVEKYGFVPCENKKLYSKLCSAKLRMTKACLTMKKPDGKSTCRSFASVDDPTYKLLKPLSQKERFLKHEEIKNA